MSDTSISLSGTEKENNRRICAKKHQKSASELDSDCDINLKFHEELSDKPEILGFIKQLQKLIKKQEKKIRKLKKSAKKCVCKGGKSKVASVHDSEVIKNDVAVQTSDLEEFISSQKPKTITEEIKEAAENAMAQTGFVYEATSGMYYDYKTGYYYNAELGLYYDGNTGTYLSYDATSDTYTFHSQMDVVSTKPLIEEYKRQKRKQRKEQENDGNKRTKLKLAKKKKHTDKVMDDVPTISLEEGECSGSDRSSDVEIVVSSDSEADCGENAKSWPPCMRVIVKESEKPDKLKIGSLFIITCDGGTIGREGDHSILIPDINVSKVHARITFDRDTGKYMISDLGSQNGTVLNGARISDAKQISELTEVAHGSTVQIGTNKLLCHVHEGLKTCGHCEPGLVQIEQPAKLVTGTEKSASKGTLHKQELRRLRKKFGLETQGNNTDLAEGYSDRAGDRRKFVGSHDGNEKTQMASLNESIPAENKGFKMLAKMGWNEGQALGKDGSGLTEPVALVSNQGKTGLGNTSDAIPAASASSLRKHNVWKKAQQRFQQVQEVNLEAFKESSTDDENPFNKSSNDNQEDME